EGERLRWGLAGRSRAKLEQVRANLARTRPRLAELPLLSADSGDLSSLKELARRARVIITTVGPYARYGEPLVQACAEVGADYVDLTGEPAFVERMIERHHQTASARGAKIVHACGFDSVPHDLGAYFTLQTLRGELSASERDTAAVTIEGFVRAGGTFSGGTWHSAVNAMAEARTDAIARKQRAKERTPDGGRRVRGLPASFKYRDELGFWALPMPTIDPQIVLRSARQLEEYGPDFRYGHYLGLKRVTTAVGLGIGISAVFTLAQWQPTRSLLLKLRDPGEGPDEAARQRGWFKVTFQGSAAGKQVTCQVTGGDPGYGETAKMLAESALSLAFDRDQQPPHVSIVTPAAALGRPLIERLQRAGIGFRQLA
ncbi:MAG TPA: saccharopine dehydrogenase NADP-binding domain-containing protein, partial [Polyangiales bacterium]